MKYLILKGCSGLGNRLHTLCSAIEYCQKSDRVLIVDWSDGQFGKRGENVFDKYFHINEIPTLIEISQIDNISNLTIYPTTWRGRLDSSLYELFVDSSSIFWGRYIGRFEPKGRISRLVSCWRVKESRVPRGVLSKLSDIFLDSCMTYGSNYEDSISEDIIIFADFIPKIDYAIFLKYISLKPDISQEIDRYQDRYQLSKDTIGVHVRDTDKSIGISIDKLFLEIDYLYTNNMKIFLATDNQNIERLFIQKYNHVVIYPKNLPTPNQKRGIHMWGIDHDDEEYNRSMFKDSIIDMWLLSKCEYLLYQGNSSFSVISKHLHKNQERVYDWQR